MVINLPMFKTVINMVINQKMKISCLKYGY